MISRTSLEPATSQVYVNSDNLEIEIYIRSVKKMDHKYEGNFPFSYPKIWNMISNIYEGFNYLKSSNSTICVLITIL